MSLRAVVLGTLLSAAVFAAPLAAHAEEPAAAAQWCAPETEALPHDVCYLNGSTNDAAKRTLVIFLGGAVAKNVSWQHNHMRGLLKLAKGNNVEALYPKSPLTDVGYVWPGSLKDQERDEQKLIDEWMNAKRLLEMRSGRPFDEVFVFGFSSGAYFVSSLAMRGRMDVDGYATMAGGQAQAARPTPIERFVPVFVGVCSQDETSAAHSRAFAGALSAAGIKRMVVEQPVGHGLSHVHFNGALGFLRDANKVKLAAR